MEKYLLEKNQTSIDSIQSNQKKSHQNWDKFSQPDI